MRRRDATVDHTLLRSAIKVARYQSDAGELRPVDPVLSTSVEQVVWLGSISVSSPGYLSMFFKMELTIVDNFTGLVNLAFAGRRAELGIQTRAEKEVPS